MSRMQVIRDSIGKGAASYFVIAFTGYFVFGGVEAQLTPYAQHYMHWGNIEVSLWFCTVAVLALTCTLTSKFLSARGIRDRTFLLVGQVCTVGDFRSCISLYCRPLPR
jgi:hypothetical protein